MGLVLCFNFNVILLFLCLDLRGENNIVGKRTLRNPKSKVETEFLSLYYLLFQSQVDQKFISNIIIKIFKLLMLIMILINKLII